MNRALRSFKFACVALLLFSSFSFARQAPCPSSGFDQQVAKFRNYTIRTIRTEVWGCLEVRKSGVVVYRESNEIAYGIGNRVYNDPAIPAIKVGTDITGGGVPEAIVWSWSGGIHCCFTFQVLQLSRRIVPVAQIDAEHSDDAHFADLRHDGHYEFVGRDWDFAYWHASFGESPAPEIILKPPDYMDLALDLMKRPPPTDVDFHLLVHELATSREWSDNRMPPRLWGEMLNLIFTGHPNLAWELVDQTWPKKRPGKGGFIGAFCDQLEQAPYWHDLDPLLKNAPADCFR